MLGILAVLDLVWTLIIFPWSTRHQRKTIQELPQTFAPALVLGAGVLSGGEPSPLLAARLRTAAELYRNRQVRWILVSGDNRTANYNEPRAMRRWLEQQGIPATRIVNDYAGRRTFDSLKRAREIFGIHRMVIVTSDFHLPRALAIAQDFGMEAWGVAASTREHGFLARGSFWFREYFARHKALWDRWFPPDTLLGPREPTPEDWMRPTEMGR